MSYQKASHVCKPDSKNQPLQEKALQSIIFHSPSPSPRHTLYCTIEER